MATNRSFKSNVNNFSQSDAFFERPRLHKLLESAVCYPVLAVYAGAGYGKTRTIYSFLQEYNAYTTWIQLSERDNTPERFWEKFTHMLSLTWSDLGKRLAKIGFPETSAAFAKFSVESAGMFSSKDKMIMVFDDFHILNNITVLGFFEKMISSLPENGTVITISRTMPEINIVGMMMQERVYTIREDSLCFTEKEIAEYFNQLSLRVTRQDIHDIYDDTHGWAFAINLIGRSLSKDMKYERNALVAMKENIFKLIEWEISNIRNKPLWQLLLRISLIGHLAASLIRTLTDDDSLIKELDSLNAYIRYDHHLGVYRIHDLFMDYLRQYQGSLPNDVKCDTYSKAGLWCEENNYKEDALAYYEKAGDYDAVIRIVYMFNMEVSRDLTKYAMRILERMPQESASRNPFYPAMIIKAKFRLGLLDEASSLAERYAAEYASRDESYEKNRALAEIYNVWSVVRLLMSSYTDAYDFDGYFKKMRQYCDKAQPEVLRSLTNQSAGAHSLLIGTNRAGAPEEYIAALRKAIPYCAHVLEGNMRGFDDLAQGELLFCRREINGAEQYFNQALDKARTNRQYDIQNRALRYLMLIAFSRGELDAANKMLSQIEAMLSLSEYAARYEAYDIAQGLYFLTLGRHEQTPDWLKSDFDECGHPAFLEGYTNQIRGQYHFLTHQYSKLLAFLENEKVKQTLLTGRIEYKVLEALSRYKLGHKDNAIAALSEAYALAQPNGIIILFTRHAKDMRTLTEAAIKDENCAIPKAWLEEINRKSSAFARRLTYMISQYNEANNDEAKVSLSSRETKVLRDLVQGLSRSEVAASQNLSINTVKMVISSIYDKLGATSLHEALRIAILRNLIK